MAEFYVGQIFEDTYTKEVADWCNENKKQIIEIEPITKDIEEEYETFDKVVIPATDTEEEQVELKPITKKRMVKKTFRRFEIAELTPPSEKETLQRELVNIEAWLREHDYIGTKIATGRATKEDYADEIKQMIEYAERKDEILKQLTKE